MDHLSDDIPRLLTGDATRDEVLAAAEHLRGCPDCQQELVSAVVAHASLTSARRFAPEVVALVPPGEPSEGEASDSLPDLTAVFAQVRAEAGQPSTAVPRRRLRIAGIVAAAAVVVGGGTAAIVETTTSSSSQQQALTVALSAFHDGKAPATATIVGTSMRIDAAKLPRLDAEHFYEVWLTDSARTTMWPLGAIPSDNRAQLPVPLSVMGRYSAIEVSVQQVSQTKYSGVSVLRGSYR
jgi:hypothetical protein